MQTKRQPSFARSDGYTRIAIAFHWVIALLIVSGFTIGWIMTRIPGFTPEKLRYFSWHKWIGVTVFALVLVRVLWRLTHEAPPLPSGMSAWQRMAANAVHGLLYLLMIAVPVTGYLYSSAANVPVVYLGLIPLPRIIDPNPEWKAILKAAHITLDYGLGILVLAHVAAALKHQWIDRDKLLSRMIPFLK